MTDYPYFVLRWSGHGSVYAQKLDHDFEESNFFDDPRSSCVLRYYDQAFALDAKRGAPDGDCLQVEEVQDPVTDTRSADEIKYDNFVAGFDTAPSTKGDDKSADVRAPEGEEDPNHEKAEAAYPPHKEGADGLTKREEFAARSMQGMRANPEYNTFNSKSIAGSAVADADALLAELAKESTP